MTYQVRYALDGFTSGQSGRVPLEVPGERSVRVLAEDVGHFVEPFEGRDPRCSLGRFVQNLGEGAPVGLEHVGGDQCAAAEILQPNPTTVRPRFAR